MRMTLRFLVPLLLVLGGIAWATTPLLGELMQRWFRTDVEMRSQLVFDSIQDTVAGLAKDSAGPRIDGLFQRIAQDKRLVAVGLCSPEGRLVNRSPTMVSENNIYFWAGRMLLTAARLRKRSRIEAEIAQATSPFGRPRKARR